MDTVHENATRGSGPISRLNAENDDLDSTSSDDDSSEEDSSPTVKSKPPTGNGLLASSAPDNDAPRRRYGDRFEMTSTSPVLAIRDSGSDAKKSQQEKRRQAVKNHDSLLQAVRENQLIEVERLIKLKVDVDMPDPSGYTALHYAADAGRLAIVERLVEIGVDTAPRTPEGYTPLMLAAKHRRRDVVDYLANPRLRTDAARAAALKGASSADASPQPENAPRRPREESVGALEECEDPAMAEALTNAVANGALEAAARLIASGPRDWELTTDAGLTRLAQAAVNGDVEMIRLLLCAGAEVDSPSHGSDNDTALMCAVNAKQPAAIRVLLAAGARTDVCNRSGNCAAELAVDSGDLAVLEALVNDGSAGWDIPSTKPPLIMRAAMAGDVEVTKYLLKRKAYPLDKNGNHPLALMAKAPPTTGKTGAIRTLLQAGADILQKNRNGDTAFMLAAAHGDKNVVDALIAQHPAGMSAGRWRRRLQGETDRHGRTALMHAVLNRKAEMTSHLLAHGADPLRADYAGRNAILWAAAKGDVATATALMGIRATLAATDVLGNTIVATAAKHGNTEVLKLFCETRHQNGMINIDTPNLYGDTPLLLAARYGRVEAARLLLSNGASLLLCNKLGRSALLECARHGDVTMMETLTVAEAGLPKVYPFLDFLIKAIVGAVPMLAAIMPSLRSPRMRRTDNAGNAMLHLIASHGHDSLLHRLLDPHSKTLDRRSEVDGDDTLVEIDPPAALPPEAIDLEATNAQGMTPLSLAARNGHVGTALALIKNGAILNHADHNGCTPLWHACSPRQPLSGPGIGKAVAKSERTMEKMALAMIVSGALPDQPSFRGQTPLIAASASGMPGVVQRLLREGANFEHADDHGYTALMYAAQHGHLDIVKSLLRKGAQPDARPDKTSALVLAAAAGHDAVVGLLVERAADVDQVDWTGATALIRALRAGKLSTVKSLIGLGADLNPKDQYGNCAMDYAERAGHGDLVRAMVKANLA